MTLLRRWSSSPEVFPGLRTVPLEQFNEMKHSLEEKVAFEKRKNSQNKEAFLDLYSYKFFEMEKLKSDSEDTITKLTLEAELLKKMLATKHELMLELDSLLTSKELEMGLVKKEMELLKSEKGVSDWYQKYFEDKEDEENTRNQEVPMCEICNEDFGEKPARTPRMLSCGHTLCQDCVDKLSQANGQILCPWDRLATFIYQRNMAGLPKNFSLLDIVRSVAKQSDKKERIDNFWQLTW